MKITITIELATEQVPPDAQNRSQAAAEPWTPVECEILDHEDTSAPEVVAAQQDDLLQMVHWAAGILEKGITGFGHTSKHVPWCRSAQNWLDTYADFRTGKLTGKTFRKPGRKQFGGGRNNPGRNRHQTRPRNPQLPPPQTPRPAQLDHHRPHQARARRKPLALPRDRRPPSPTMRNNGRSRRA